MANKRIDSKSRLLTNKRHSVSVLFSHCKNLTRSRSEGCVLKSQSPRCNLSLREGRTEYMPRPKAPPRVTGPIPSETELDSGCAFLAMGLSATCTLRPKKKRFNKG